MKKRIKKAFILIDIILGLALLGLLASVVYPSITSTRVGFSRLEKKTIVIDQAQRITQTLKSPCEKNNDLFSSLTLGGSLDYKDSLLTGNLEAKVYLDEDCPNYQVYSVEVSFLGEDISAKFQATRDLQ